MSEQTQPSDVEQKIESMHNAFSRYLRASDKSSKDQSLADILRCIEPALKALLARVEKLEGTQP